MAVNSTPSELDSTQTAQLAFEAQQAADKAKDLTYLKENVPIIQGIVETSAKDSIELGKGFEKLVNDAMNDPKVWGSLSEAEKADLVELRDSGVTLQIKAQESLTQTQADYKIAQAENGLADAVPMTEESAQKLLNNTAQYAGVSKEEAIAQLAPPVPPAQATLVESVENPFDQQTVPDVTPNFVGPQQQLTSQGIPSGSEMGVAFDDNGNVKPGWAKDASGQFYVETDPAFIDPATAEQANSDRQAYQNSLALNEDGSLKDGYTFNEFGTPVVAEPSSTLKQNPETGEMYTPVPPPLESGIAIRNEDGTYSTSRINPETGELYDPVPGSIAQKELEADPTPQKEVPVSTQTFDDGSQLETYADGSTVSTDSEGNINFNSATVPAVQKDVTEEKPATDHGPAYDDDGNLMPGFALNEDNDAVWVGGSYVDQKTVASAAETRAAESAKHGTPYDDDGNLMPGWALTEDGDPKWVGGDFVEPATAASAKKSREAAASNKTGATNDAVNSNAKAVNKATTSEPDDWRVRLSLAPSANYLYRVAKAGDLLFPLNSTNGVLFPYTPAISTAYKASYEPGELVHSNYKMHFYKGSSVDEVTITADFTAQDTAEANYMLAVIHFFKSATKMFYGKDQSPRAGTPPPLLYISGFGAYQFDKHPLLLTSFTYTLPTDVDYIRAGSTKTWSGTNISQLGTKAVNSSASTPWDRLKAAFGPKVAPGGKAAAPAFTSGLAAGDSTYVPTKIQIQLSLIPIVTRKDISDNFSVEQYATGSLTRGSKRNGGGIW